MISESEKKKSLRGERRHKRVLPRQKGIDGIEGIVKEIESEIGEGKPVIDWSGKNQ